VEDDQHGERKSIAVLTAAIVGDAARARAAGAMARAARGG
jgi:hypothetical protein